MRRLENNGLQVWREGEREGRERGRERGREGGRYLHGQEAT